MSFLNRFMEPPPRDDVLASVIRNLLQLLNSRPGYGSRLRSYGLGDYLAEQGGKAAQLTILREIRDDIQRFEPRLRVREIWSTGRDAELRMHIRLKGMLLSPKGWQPCLLRIYCHLPSGEIAIEPGEGQGGPHAA